MTKRMLIDATHAEETRVVVLDGNRLEDYDVETSTKKQLKGNIYLAKVVRVEPSLQAAFVEYGGNRHGFLAFGEIHPDYYQIPVADRQRLMELQEQEARDEEEDEERAASGQPARRRAPDPAPRAHGPAPMPLDQDQPELHGATATQPANMAREVRSGEAEDNRAAPGDEASEAAPSDAGAADDTAPANDIDSLSIPPFPTADLVAADPATPDLAAEAPDMGVDLVPELGAPSEEVLTGTDTAPTIEARAVPEESETGEFETQSNDEPPPELVGGELDTSDERSERRPSRHLRNYKIQEVIRRRQILLIQVVKEERGTKGAALTTYISMAGRFCVLMPNSPRGGGVSRKITSVADRKRLKEVMQELDLPRGMGLIVRTAGAARPKPEIKRDCEYLLRLWDDIRERTLGSMAPALIHEEASLIKRAIRDVYSRDVDDILVDGEEGWRAAHDFMRMLMPSHARKVQLWNEGGAPLFARHAVEAQLDAMLSPNVQLKSGGYLVINQTEALVAIDVNSGRSTRERGIEETALRTNLEAADEVARQLRLRDLAGLIVIDFIDMESKKHNAMVERRMKEALKNDRARIQIGQISHFGLMEMSRQRLRPSLAETSFVPCAHCAGTGMVRSIETAAMHVLRAIEDEGAKRRAAEIQVHVAGSIALYILNHKRAWLAEIESRHMMEVTFASDDSLLPPELRIDRVRAQLAQEFTPVLAPPPPPMVPAAYEPEEADVDFAEPIAEASESEAEAAENDPGAVPGETAVEAEQRRKRRRRRRRGGRRDDVAGAAGGETAGSESAGGDLTAEDRESEAAEGGEAGEPGSAAVEAGEAETGGEPSAEAGADAASGDDADGKRGRRGRRGGRRRRRDEAPGEVFAPDAPQPYVPAYVGPTPADPFGGATFDIFDAIEQQLAAEHEAAQQAAATQSVPVTTVTEDVPAAPEHAPQTEAVVAAASEPAAAPELPPATPEMLAEPAHEAPEPSAPAAAESASAEPVVTPEPMPVVETAAPEPIAPAPEETAATASPEPLIAPEPVPVVETAASEPIAPAPEETAATASASPEPLVAPEPVPEPVPVVDSAAPAHTASDETVIAEPATSEPAIKPILVGSDDVVGEKKRGWWRR